MRMGRRAVGLLLSAGVLGLLGTASPGLAATRAPTATPTPTPTPTAGPLPPGETRSHYLTSVDQTLLSRTGTADAVDASAQGLAQGLVVLDAGSPAGTDGSVRLPDSHVHTLPDA